MIAYRPVRKMGTTSDSIPLEALFLKALHIFFPGMQQGITLFLAIGLYFRAVQPQGSSKPTWVLAALTSLTLLVHPYLMVMVGALLGAIPLSIFFREKRWKACRPSAAATLTAGASILLAGKVLGYWGGASGGGLWNLLHEPGITVLAGPVQPVLAGYTITS
ncbi:hypothetical protein JK200_18080 [Gluconobacter cerinus]|nr:hypothetical protein [Gluconobacter cerinus]